MKRYLLILILAAACGPKTKPAAKQPVGNDTANGGASYGDEWDEYGGDGYGYGDAYGEGYGYGGYEEPYVPPPPQPPAIAGTWVSACGAAPEAGDYLTLTFVNTASDWDLNVGVFGDAACTKRKSLVHVAGTYTFGAQSATVADAWEGTFTFTKREITADDKKTAKAIGKLCGLKKMKPGVAVDILEKGCPKMGFKPVADCAADNDLVAVQGLDLRFGVRPADNDLCTADKRPTALQTAVDIVYQIPSSGLPQCDAMLASYAKIINCPKASSVRDAMTQAMSAMRNAWGDTSKMDAATQKAMNDACMQADQGLQQTLSALGC